MKLYIEEIVVEPVDAAGHIGTDQAHAEAAAQGSQADAPQVLAEVIAAAYSGADRLLLANAAAKAALEGVAEQYRGGPIGTNIAQSATRMALGLQPLPYVPEQGEQ